MKTPTCLIVVIAIAGLGCAGQQQPQPVQSDVDRDQDEQTITKVIEPVDQANAEESTAHIVDVELTADGVIRVNGVELSEAEFERRLFQAVFSAWDKHLASSVRITATDDARYRDLKAVVDATTRHDFDSVELQVPGYRSIRIPNNRFAGMEHLGETINVNLRAHADGSLASIQCNSRRYRDEEFASLSKFKEFMHNAVETQYDVDAVVDAEEELRLKHFVDVWQFLKQMHDEAGRLVNVQSTIWWTEVDEVEASDFVMEDVETLQDIPLTDDPSVLVTPPITETEDVSDIFEGMGFGERAKPTPLNRGFEIGEDRAEMIKKRGGTEASETAVSRALQWLAKHQLPDGGWSFDHRMAMSCGQKCSQPGNFGEARNAATGLALLAFLGAMQSRGDDPFQDQANRGLKYLVSHMKPVGGGGSWHEAGGTMYSHGIAALAMCEAYATTKDREFLAPAQAGLNFIAYAQDPVGGGWRYEPKQSGDTSVLSWQLAALKSGNLAYLQIQPSTVRGAMGFLDTVSSDAGAFYGYRTDGRRKATTAMGLLSRHRLGWTNENPAVKRGVQWLSEQGPAVENDGFDLYYNYYATHVLYHLGDVVQWEKWNAVMREALIESQVQDTDSHEYGSWHVNGDLGSDRGGRLYCTALAAMILEIYYRNPQEVIRDQFPL